MIKRLTQRKKSMFYQKIESFIYPAWQKVNSQLIHDLEIHFKRWPAFPKTDHRTLYEFTAHHIETLLRDIENMHQVHHQFNQTYKHAVTSEEEQESILEYAQKLGASTRQLIGDRRAFSRWFGYDAVVDRYQRTFSQSEHTLSFYLEILQTLAPLFLHEIAKNKHYSTAWKRLALEEVIAPILTYEGDDRVRIAAFSAFSAGIRALPTHLQEHSVNEQSLHFIYRSVIETKQNVWIQCAAFDLLQTLSSRSFAHALQQRLTHPKTGDDLFVRRKAVQLMGKNIKHNPKMVNLFPHLLKDPSPFVRQAIADNLQHTKNKQLILVLTHLALQDHAPQVRAAALLSIPKYLNRLSITADLQHLVIQSLKQEKDAFVLKIGLHTAFKGYTLLPDNHPQKKHWQKDIKIAFHTLHQHAPDLSIRHDAAQLYERLWCESDIDARSLTSYLQKITTSIRAGQSKKVSRDIILQYGEQTIGRVLAMFAQHDFSYELITHRFSGVRLYKGHRFHFRLWRFIHELFRPSPDKRQAFSHTTGRSFRGLMHIPSGLLSEVAETKVPGEPVLITEESDCRSYLPLVDELLCCLDFGSHKKPLNIYSLQGITTLSPPVSLLQRAYAKTHITLHFAHYAAIRNWQQSQLVPPTQYIDSLKKLGFTTVFHPYPTTGLPADPKVSRFFSLIPFSGTGIEFWQRLRDYFFSMYQNTLYDLIICITFAITAFVSRHLYLSHQIHRIRQKLPMSIGGWGTRGKSGTERLKAGMINALGHHVVSKTTGCEALFLHAYPFGKLREMFLFRPYDKATIWEQYNLLHISQGLGANVFLWECMALTPEYVKTMQRQWMRDDIATITNCHPDHEDLQGPSGLNIPQVMTHFIPEKATLLTTEEQMLPILREESAKIGTRMESIGWKEAGLLTDDILARFPYDEHPYNIALVVALGKELGVSKEFALKEMADRVILDIGVLKVFPKAKRQSRTLEFTNGMSANERFGCLGNWNRVGFDRQNIYTEPSIWISTVVNNRADRVARSRVFASIIAQDLQVEKHFLIGSNLGGLMHDILATWHKHIAHIFLFTKDNNDIEQAMTTLENIAKKLRIPYQQQHITDRIHAMLKGIGIHDETLLATIQHVDDLAKLHKTETEPYLSAIKKEWQQYEHTLNSYHHLATRVKESKGSHDNIHQQFREQITHWFEQKFVIIDNYHANGEYIIHQIYRHTPPGITNRVMGIQNIKGTGMDFIYRWIAWETCHRACQEIMLNSKQKAQQGLKDLLSFQQFGLLSEELVQDTIEQSKHRKWTQIEIFQAELQVIESRLHKTIEHIQQQLSIKHVRAGVRGWLTSHIETWMDAADAVKRRKKADAIYRDLISERISHDRASDELKALNNRQKGGWLIQRLHTWIHPT